MNIRIKEGRASSAISPPLARVPPNQQYQNGASEMRPSNSNLSHGSADYEEDIDSAVKMAKTEMQRSLEIELALFMSAAGINAGANNFYFRQFLSNLRPDFKLPPVGVTMDRFLQNVYINIVRRMTQILAEVDKFTLMMNFISLDAFEDCHYVCVSVAFELNQELEIFLLDVCRISTEIFSQPKQIALIASDVLKKYYLGHGQITRTLISGLDLLHQVSILPLLIQPLNCTYHKQLPALLNEVLTKSTQCMLIKNAVMLMTGSFEQYPVLCQKFKEVTGVEIDTRDLNYDKLVSTLLKYKATFLELCKTTGNAFYILTEEQWAILDEISRLKSLFCGHFNVIKDGETIITIDQVVPFFNMLFNALQQDFKLLKQIPLELVEKMHQSFSYILNSNDTDFEPLYLEAAYLNPRYASSNLLTDQQKMLAELLFADENKLGERADRMAALINNYKSVISDQHKFMAVNPYEFWHSKIPVFGKLAKFAIQTLCIPIEATLPFESCANSTDEIDGLAPNNHYTYIKLSQMVKDLERNTIIRVNKKLYDASHAPGPIDSPEVFVQNVTFDDTRDYRQSHSRQSGHAGPDAGSSHYEFDHRDRRSPYVQQRSPIRHSRSPYVQQRSRSRSRSPYVQQRSRSRTPVRRSRSITPIRQYPMGRNRSPGREKKFKMSPLRRTPEPFYDLKKKMDAKRMYREEFRPYQTPVMLIYGVNQVDFTPQKVYNLFCNYGDVLKVKFIMKKRDTCFVQMGTTSQATTASKFLNELQVYRTRLTIRPSRDSMNIAESFRDIFRLENGKDSFAQYETDVRFDETEMRIDMAFPSARVHFLGVPPHFDARDLEDAFRRKYPDGPLPKKIAFDNTNPGGLRSGLMWFKNGPVAGEAISMYNNLRFPDTDVKFRIHFTRRTQ